MKQDDKINEKILKESMRLFAEQGWNNTTFVQIAEKINLPVFQLRKKFPFKACLLIYLNRQADQNALTQIYHDQPVSEYLFDLMMNRFDIFQQYRDGIISIIKILPFHPHLALLLTLETERSMKWIAESSLIKTNGVKGLICIKGLTAMWTIAMKTWVKDHSSDLSETMACLDRTIKKAGKIAPFIVERQQEFSYKKKKENEAETELRLLTNENNL